MKSAHNAKYNSDTWIGKRYGKLVVAWFTMIEKKRGRQWHWVCSCDCGKQVIVEPYNVLSGHTLSCGCMKTHHGALKHGESGTKLYKIWAHMVRRCTPDASDKSCYRYAQRGIKVCDQWMKYNAFALWAKENGYVDGLSIERINNDGDYTPENCKWIEWGKQARNRSTTLWVNYMGQKMSLAEACEIAKMPYKTVHYRIRSGKSIEEALSTPIKALKRSANRLK